MATENIVTGKFYRILKNASSKTWDRISFWTHADDVSLSNGTTLSSDLNTKQTKINATQTDFAQVENSSTSAHAYTKGQMLIYNNQLYRVKAAIAVGNTLSTSTNIEVASVSTLSSMLTANNGNQFYFDVKNGQYGFYPTASKTSSQFVPFGGTAGYQLFSSITFNQNNISGSYFSYPKYYNVKTITIDKYVANNSQGGMCIKDVSSDAVIYPFGSGTFTDITIDCSGHEAVYIGKTRSDAIFTCAVTNFKINF